ncbi:UNKNOWN [Stylonychia lemnae]|uniref:carbonic anhydrase n=1 Tax=Stylonychia lemnae TaxID=5949 RepID=A0A078A341_STYLE|nr:UNKNOWN [Stylonychia lemnae]|eukprot:CDW76242.1 UNKNOWN [Stylonychia lemnae]
MITSKAGASQSPIHIPLAANQRRKYDYNGIKQSPNIHFSIAYQTIQDLQFVDENDTISAYENFGNMSFTTHFGQSFDLQASQIKIHAPSEHKLNELHMDVEVQIIHTDKMTGQPQAVVSLFYDQDHAKYQHNPFLENFVLNGNSSKNVQKFNLAQAFKNITSLNKRLFYYQGSMTTPPCQSGIQWLIVNEIQPLSTDQYNYFYGKWMHNHTFADGNGNNRKVYPLGGFRKIYQKFDHVKALEIIE